MMERFLERLSISNYKNNFIIKGGILISTFVGTSLRSTMDIDTTFNNQNLDLNNIKKIIINILNERLEDGISFDLKNIEKIMDEMEYPGFRISINGKIKNAVVPFKIDISTGDSITPRAIETTFNLTLKNKKIVLWTYNLETTIAEKFQTIIVRDIFNARMRDFYDIYILLKTNGDKIDYSILKNAYIRTSSTRKSTHLFGKEKDIIFRIENDSNIKDLWNKYTNKYSYAANISFFDIMKSIEKIGILIR